MNKIKIMLKIFQFQDLNGLFEDNYTLTIRTFIIKNKPNNQCNKYDKKILFNYLIIYFTIYSINL